MLRVACTAEPRALAARLTAVRFFAFGSSGRTRLHICAGSLDHAELSDTLGALLSAVSSLALNPLSEDTVAKFRVELADSVLAEAGPFRHQSLS